MISTQSSTFQRARINTSTSSMASGSVIITRWAILDFTMIYTLLVLILCDLMRTFTNRNCALGFWNRSDYRVTASSQFSNSSRPLSTSLKQLDRLHVLIHQYPLYRQK